MKTAAILLSLSFCTIFLACQRRSCYKCITTVNTVPDSLAAPTTDTNEICDLSSDEKRDYEVNNTSTIAITTGTDSGMQYTVTTCK